MFYEAQRAGELPNDQRVKWRNSSGLLDGSEAGQDLTGGYYDAGDYIKFIYPLTFTLTEICYGALEFYDGYVLANQTHYLDQMVRWGTDWLIKAHPNDNTLYVQVGIAEVDNNYWGPDTSIPNPRPVFFVSDTKPGTDVMADAAAAFASCSIMYRDKLHDATYAATLQTHAEVLYKLAETSTPQQVYQKVVPAASCCYPSTSYLHDLAWGAAWLFRLTNDVVYANKASAYTDRVISQKGDLMAPISWDDKIGFVYILMASLTRGMVDGSKWQNLAEGFAAFTINAAKPCSFTKGGMYYCYGSSGDDSAVVAANAALALALLASHMEATSNTSYRAFALKQIRYILGDNPEKTPYIVGVHPNSPMNPHSALAAAGNGFNSIDTSPAKDGHELFGAVVGGPDKNDRFMDQRSNWRQNEVALDYNAPFTGLMAYQVMTSHEPPPYIHVLAGQRNDPPSGTFGSMATWLIALIASLASAIVLVLGIFICRRKRN
ncbi:Six-hairpin glycosidase-like protein [Dissophora ornata]|nr:Six-hairpin glycosidase-like protein [Dissophora ornata]